MNQNSDPKRPPHPGRGGPGRFQPKGRQLDPVAEAEIAALLGPRPRTRDLLVEYLHLIQDRYRQISAAHLAALAAELRLSLTEVYEVATFYAHFDVTLEGDAPVPDLTVRLCEGIACQLAGAEALLSHLSAQSDDRVRILRVPCIGQCDCAPAVVVGQHVVTQATASRVAAIVASGETSAFEICRIDYDAYRAAGGYRLFEALFAGETDVEDVLGSVDISGLKGLGGAGFPASRKWRAVRDMPGPRLMIVNADEGEPGTFKDRFYLENDPHRCLEGALIAALIVGASEIYFYLRDEYAGLRATLTRELAKLPANWPRIRLRRGAGAYICGEESALIESIEGKRGLPRQRPPLPYQAGLFGRPTLTNNVETLFWIRDIVEKGPDWWRTQGRNGRSGLRSYSVSGRVREPGVKCAPAGITLRELLDEYCGGMSEGHELRAYLPGGASGGILPARLAGQPLDFGTLEEHGCFIGSAAIVVLSQEDDLKDVARNLMHFFADESCGQCTPCRLGTKKASQLMQEENWDLDLLLDLSGVMRDASICGLGQAAPNPLLCLIKYFPEEFAGARA
ncbi:MAG: Respiratory-chain dehydrogenase domain 51 kDa subunit [Hyphomicrobiales bacterium]|nr:Respiratory-chain dehydrogenase domain 51 kDa subunit [Hyphomicrobiales bacterium]